MIYMLYLVMSVLLENIFCNRFVLSEPWVLMGKTTKDYRMQLNFTREYILFNTIIMIRIKWRKK